MKLKIDDVVIEYKNSVQAHDDLIKNRYDCTCHCEACKEEDCWECLESTLDQNYPGWSIV